MAWTCVKCGERIKAIYNYCWDCGTPNASPKISKTDKTLTLKDFIPYARPISARYLFYGVVLGTAALMVALMIIRGIIVADWRDEESWIGILTIFAFYLGVFLILFRLSKRFFIDSPRVLLKDTRRPILYLRSFSEETNAAGTYRDEAKSDETLASALRDIGPLVAVGKPGEPLQPLGAVRLYFDDEEWEEKVEALMSLSQLVVIQAGYSSRLNQSGLEWEMRLTTKELKPEQVIYSFLSWQELSKSSRQFEYEIFAMQYKRVIGQDMPPSIGDAYFMYFDQNGRPSLASPPVWQRDLVYLKLLPRLFWKFLTRPLKREPRSVFDMQVYLPTPAILRKTSSASARSALRPILVRLGAE